MAEIFENEELTERIILVGVNVASEEDTEGSLDELGELAQTAGAVTVGRMIQKRESVHPGTYLGKGKIDELRGMIDELQATGVICDDELSPAQMMNLQDALDIKVMDRTLLILDIFAQRASTKEGRIQVELAQLRYRATRLTGMGRSMSRLGGGIGTRGPGEKKLEMDRRLIHDRISQLNKELEGVKRHREVARQQRERNHIPVVAIVGYTNAGKSTLLNRLTNAGVLQEDKLFATLDPTTRNLAFDSGQEILLTDTVGFIRKLPHHLVNAFRSTLEEAKYADILIHMVDASNPQAELQMHVVYETLTQLEVRDKTIITVFNKADRLDMQDDRTMLRDFKADKCMYVSAATGYGIDDLLACIEDILRSRKVFIEHVFPYAEAGQIAVIRRNGQLLQEEYQEDGIFVQAYVPKDVFLRLGI